MAGYVISESLTDNEFTASAYVNGTFGHPRTIESITIHHWGSFGQTHDGVLDFFVNRNEATSAHFVVSDGRINCLVSPGNAAWAAGNPYGNATTIAIECRPEATDGDYATVAWLVAWLRKNYGANLPLYPHSHWTPTACPGRWDLARLDRLARTPAPKPTTPKGSTTMATSPTLAQIKDAVKSAVWPFSGARPGGKPITMWNRVVSTHELATKTAADVAAIRALLEKENTRG